MSERTVNARQLEVLEWIVAGCPDGVMTGSSHKTTAVALQNRRLAKVSRRRGVWRAEPTEAGKSFVRHGAYPEGHWQKGFGPGPEPTLRVAAPPPGREPKVTGLRPVDQMMADLEAAGGEMTVAASQGSYWENLVSSATRFGKVPDGKVLEVVRGKDWSERVIRLEEPPAGMTVKLAPVSVSRQLRNPHPAVRALRDDRDRLSMGRQVRARALRLLDAVANAAVARGHTVTAARPESGYRATRGHLVVIIGRHPNTLIVDELNDRAPHVPTKNEVRQQELYPSFTRIPTHDQVPSGRLRIRLDRGWRVRQAAFSDTKTIRLEDRLPDLLQELELRAAASEERDQRLERDRRERVRQWERVREEAVVWAREHHRAAVLAGQVERWHEGQRLDAYVQAVKAHIADLSGAEQQAAAEWLAWAREHRQRTDPLRQPLRLPPDPEFTAEELAPFMRGLSPPYGPVS